MGLAMVIVSRCVAKRLAGKYVLKFAVFHRDLAVHDRKFEFPVLETNEIRKISLFDLSAQRKAEFARRIPRDLPDGVAQGQKAVFGERKERRETLMSCAPFSTASALS